MRQVNIRLTEAEYAALLRAAQENHRSLSSEVKYHLVRSGLTTTQEASHD